MRGVASVLYHEAQARGGGVGKLREVATDAKFFTSLTSGAIPRPAEMAPADFEAWLLCGRIAAEMVSGRFRPTLNANHFHDISVFPSWTRRMAYVTSVGRMFFYWEEKA